MRHDVTMDNASAHSPPSPGHFSLPRLSPSFTHRGSQEKMRSPRPPVKDDTPLLAFGRIALTLAIHTLSAMDLYATENRELCHAEPFVPSAS
jgi:hypothetical protein